MSQAPPSPHPPASHAPERVTIARIVRSRGLRGEVVADLLTDFPERLNQLKRVFLAPPEGRGAEREMQIQRCWLQQGRAVFQFEGIGTVEAAETLRGCFVQIPLLERAILPVGKYFISDLTGCEVLRVSDGFKLGVVRDVAMDTGTPVLAVDSPRGEILIPLAEDICKRVDVAARRIEVDLPDGLLDLNP